jgi:hypothetical protein
LGPLLLRTRARGSCPGTAARVQIQGAKTGGREQGAETECRDIGQRQGAEDGCKKIRYPIQPPASF